MAKDVATLLGYQRTADAVRTHCKATVKHRLPTSSGDQQITLIPERDVYRLIMRSKLPRSTSEGRRSATHEHGSDDKKPSE